MVVLRNIIRPKNLANVAGPQGSVTGDPSGSNLQDNTTIAIAPDAGVIFNFALATNTGTAPVNAVRGNLLNLQTSVTLSNVGLRTSAELNQGSSFIAIGALPSSLDRALIDSINGPGTSNNPRNLMAQTLNTTNQELGMAGSRVQALQAAQSQINTANFYGFDNSQAHNTALDNPALPARDSNTGKMLHPGGFKVNQDAIFGTPTIKGPTRDAAGNPTGGVEYFATKDPVAAGLINADTGSFQGGPLPKDWNTDSATGKALPWGSRRALNGVVLDSTSGASPQSAGNYLATINGLDPKKYTSIEAVKYQLGNNAIISTLKTLNGYF